jgi:hypothetical protein
VGDLGNPRLGDIGAAAVRGTRVFIRPSGDRYGRQALTAVKHGCVPPRVRVGTSMGIQSTFCNSFAVLQARGGNYFRHHSDSGSTSTIPPRISPKPPSRQPQHQP